MQKTYLLALAALLFVASCKPKPQPEPQQEEQQEENGNTVGTPSIPFQQLEIAIAGSTILADGNIVGFGTGNSHSVRRIIKLSSTDGSVIWTKIIPGTDITAIQSIIAKQDGGFVLSGRMMTAPAVLLSYDKDGNQLWRKTYEQPNKSPNEARVIVADGDNMMLAVTRWVDNTVGDIWLVKVNGSGDTISTRNNVVRRSLTPPWIIRNDDNTYRILYTAANSNSIETMLMTFDGNGVLTDSMTLNYNGTVPFLEGIKRNNSETICIGHEWHNNNAVGTVVLLNSNFDVALRTYYPSDSLDLTLTDAVAVDNGYMICGTEAGGIEKSYPFVMKITGDGTVQWKKTLDPISDRRESFTNILKHGNRQILIGIFTPPGSPPNERSFIMDMNENGDVAQP